MEPPIPEWLNEEFLSKCLQGEQQNNKPIKITHFQAIPAVPAGNNYGSDLLRVTLDFQEGNEDEIQQSLSIIVKCPLENNPRAEIITVMKDVESIFYYQFMPQASKLSTDAFAPKTYFSQVPSVVVMEDLKLTGFLMADRITQLDFDHCKLYAASAAEFHAVSVAVQKIDPELVEALGVEKLYTHDEEKLYKLTNMLILEGCECASDYMEKCEEFQKYAPLLRQVSNVLMDKVIEVHQPCKIFNCLTQGDPWTTNMMFKYDEFGKVSEVKLLDFQTLRYGSPINDVVYFLWTSANNDVRDNKCDDLFQSYHSALISKLKELNCTEYLSYDDLLKIVEELSPFALMIVVAYLPFLLTPGEADLDDMVKSSQDESAIKENKSAKYFTEDYCKNHLSRHLRQMETMGVFKYLENMVASN